MTYAIITVGGKQHRVREGEWLLVDRLALEEGKAFHPDVLLIGGDGDALLGPDELKGKQVTARVSGHLLGKKVVVGKHRRRTGYRRRNGFRARLTRIEIESIGARAGRAKASAAPKAKAAPKAGRAGGNDEVSAAPVETEPERPRRAPRTPKTEDPTPAKKAPASRSRTKPKTEQGDS